MTKRTFMNRVANGEEDVLQQFLDLLNRLGIDYCAIGGLAVNTYVEPVISLDLDIIVSTEDLDELCKAADKIFTIQIFEHSVNLKSSKSDLRIQLQTDPNYQDFIHHATVRNVMGYEMRVAALEDVLQGKIWAYSDESRRGSKRQKDFADIYRLIEAYLNMRALLPDSIKSQGI